MSLRARLVEILQELDLVSEGISDEFAAELELALEMIGADESLRKASAAELKTIVNTAVQDVFRLENAAAAVATNPDAFVYLGPVDMVTRPFCAALVNKWLTREEIEQLDNGTGIGPFTGGGGWNCRHQWLPLYGPSQVAEFEHGDVAAANASAGARAAA